MSDIQDIKDPKPAPPEPVTMAKINGYMEEAQFEPILRLPTGSLMIDDFRATFTPEIVLEAAEHISIAIENGWSENPTFVSQAGVIAYAHKYCYWKPALEFEAK